MKWLITICLIVYSQLVTSAQGGFSVELSYDTVYLGNPIKIQFKIKNLNGEFVAPDLHGFYVISGPNLNSSFSLVNGEMSSEKSYSYLIMPQEPGVYAIPKAYYIHNEEKLETPEVEFKVLENPHNIEQNPEAMQFFPFLLEKQKQDSTRRKKKPKRVLKKT